MPSIDIVVRKRREDYLACLADNEGIWECGRTGIEAVGKLVFSARAMLGISIIEEKPPRAKKKGRV